MFFRHRPKIFCVGRNKTGTTSLQQALQTLGYVVAPQKPAELMTDDWALRSFRRVARFCRDYDAFQDVPFSLDFTYVVLDQLFPGSKFILTVRENAAVWYDSVIRFNRLMLGVKHTPTARDLEDFAYCGDTARRGELWRRHQLVYGVDRSQAFDRDIYTRHYERHNENVRDYFRHRPHDLLQLDVAAPDAMLRLCRFLGRSYDGRPMPHENASRPVD